MSFNQPMDPTPGAPPPTDSSLEAQLRGMILTNNPSGNQPAPIQPSLYQQQQTVPFFGMPRNMAGPLSGSDQSSYSATSGLPSMSPISTNLSPVSHGLSPPGFFFPGGSFTNIPAPPVTYQTYPEPHSGLPAGIQTTNLPSPTGLQFSPTQYSSHQSQNLGIFPGTPTHLHSGSHQRKNPYGQQTEPSQQNTPPGQRPQPPQMTAGRQLRGPHRGRNPNKSHVPRAPPPTALDHFPPLGTQPTKTKTPPPPNFYQQQQQRTQYQPLPINTYSNNPPQIRGSGPVRGNPRYSYYTGRLPQEHLDQIAAEQSHYLNELSKQIIAEASPPESEISVKHAFLKRLEVICKDISSDAKLIPFGSLVTGFATANSDLDVIFTGGAQADIPDEDPDDSSPDFRIPMLLESKLVDEGFTVTLLTKTRVPILKLVQKATEESPHELQCDIGFSNHLALYNTQMLLTYSKCDPRVKQMMIFIKWWAKRRHINSPYRGTLSSYGYALLVLHYLINIVEPPVLPNLQAFPIPEEAPEDEIIFEGDSGELFEIWFYRSIEQLAKSENKMHLGELLKGFFEYYAFKFQWSREVVSIRTKGGLLTKQEKGWVAAVIRPGRGEHSEVKDRYLFAVEDPFETTHNVSRTCNGPGVMRIKDEIKRAIRLIKFRDGGRSMSDCLCMEAPPERPWVRREDKDKDKDKDRQGGGDGETQNPAGAPGRHEEQTRDGATKDVKDPGTEGGASAEVLKYGGPVIG